MLRIAKLSLFLAPLMLASMTGCATPAWMSRAEPTDPREARVNRLLAVAADYEAEGKQEEAMRVYEHVIAQQPDHPLALERRELMAQQGVPVSDRKLERDQLGSPEATLGGQRPLASATPKSEVETQKLAEEIKRQNAELAKKLAKDQAPPTVAIPAFPKDSVPGVTPTPADPQALIAEQKTDIQEILNPKQFVDDPGWSSTTSGSGWQTASTEPASNISFPEEQSFAVSQADSSSEESGSQFDEFSDWASSSDVETKIELTGLAPEEKSGTQWETTDLTRQESAAATLETNDSNWSKTRLVTLCDDLPMELIPLVEQLESPNPEDRVTALRALGERGADAKGASVAVHALLEDQTPIVSVHAAGTLRQIADDAWDSVHTLAKHLKNEDQGIVQLSAYLLGQMGPEAMDAVPALEKLRESETGITSLHAAEALTHIAPADSASVNKLRSALQDQDRQVRWFAAVSLGTVSGDSEPQAAQALKAALQDQEPEVRVAACLSLGGLGNQAEIAIPELEQAAESDAPEVRSAAETALACLRS